MSLSTARCRLQCGCYRTWASRCASATLAVPNASRGYYTDMPLLDVQMKVASRGRRTSVKLRSADVRKLLGSANYLDPFKYRHCFVGRKEGQVL